ncbi:MAG TPA: CBS domain-containing protein [Pseudomonadales bacterium]|nr:CBS domain-containing protein [Pseudomonadales bacterium]
MNHEPHVKSVMSPFPYSVALDAPLLEARRLMLEHHVRHLPVTQHHELKGIITDRDIKLLLGPEMDYPNPRELTVEDAFVADPYVVDIDAPLSEVVLTMAKRHIGAALVTGHGRLAGIFTASDACRVLGEWLRERFPHGNDAA